MVNNNQKANVVNNLKVIFLHSKKYIIISVVSIVLIAVIVYVYKTISKVKKDKIYADNNEFLYKEEGGEVSKNKNAELILFWANWCPHSTEGKKEWDKFEQQYNGSKINHTTLIMYSRQCDKDEAAKSNPNTDIEKYNIEEVPTVILVKGKEDTVEMQSKLTVGNLKQFLENSL